MKIHLMKMSNLDQFSPISVKLVLYTNVVDQENI